MSPMYKYLKKLIDESPHGYVSGQVIFKPGAGQNSGALRYLGNDMFGFCTAVETGKNAPDHLKDVARVMVEYAFEADAVQAFVREVNDDGSVKILTPGGAPARA